MRRVGRNSVEGPFYAKPLFWIRVGVLVILILLALVVKASITYCGAAAGAETIIAAP